ncbi:MAG: DinB family protein [Cellulomonas sp.]|nr:DinB family protein [Cellulomonas sp.]
MNGVDVLTDGFGRVGAELQRCLAGLDRAALTYRLDPQANTIAWLAWHLAREEDAQIAPLAGTEQVWTAQGWADRFALPLEPSDMGYGHTSDQVALVVAEADLLLGYQAATATATAAYLARLRPEDLDDVIDRRWDPPVTRGVRLMSVLADSLQHLGQAELVRGVIDRRR